MDFIIYRSDLGTPAARPIVRWGSCPAGMLDDQASGPGEVARAISAFTPEDPHPDGPQVRYFYDPAAGDISALTAAPTPAVCARIARRRRAAALADSDWTQLPDNPLPDGIRAAWAAYRQALRDLPTHPDWPDVVWPQTPK